MNVCTPQEVQWKPPLRQAAGTLPAMAGRQCVKTAVIALKTNCRYPGEAESRESGGVTKKSFTMAKIFVAEKERDADVKVFRVERERDADLIVCMVDKDREAKGDALWFYVNKDREATVKIFWVAKERESDLKVFITDRPRDAKWNKSHSWANRLE